MSRKYLRSSSRCCFLWWDLHHKWSKAFLTLPFQQLSQFVTTRSTLCSAKLVMTSARDDATLVQEPGWAAMESTSRRRSEVHSIWKPDATVHSLRAQQDRSGADFPGGLRDLQINKSMLLTTMIMTFSFSDYSLNSNQSKGLSCRDNLLLSRNIWRKSKSQNHQFAIFKKKNLILSYATNGVSPAIVISNNFEFWQISSNWFFGFLLNTFIDDFLQRHGI